MIDIEKVDYVMEKTNATYKVVRNALISSNGDVNLAIEKIRSSFDSVIDDTWDVEDSREDSKSISLKDIIDNIKEIWNTGNASRLVVKKDDEIILNISLTVSAITLVLAPLISVVGVGIGFISNYDFTIIMKDKEEINLRDYIMSKRFKN